MACLSRLHLFLSLLLWGLLSPVSSTLYVHLPPSIGDLALEDTPGICSAPFPWSFSNVDLRTPIGTYNANAPYLCQSVSGLPRGAILFAVRGLCLFEDKARIAQSLGAVALYIVDTGNEEPTIPSVTNSSITIPILTMGASNYSALFQYLFSGVKGSVSWNAPCPSEFAYGLNWTQTKLGSRQTLPCANGVGTTTRVCDAREFWQVPSGCGCASANNWPSAYGGQTVTARCNGQSYSRLCNFNGNWDTTNQTLDSSCLTRTSSVFEQINTTNVTVGEQIHFEMQLFDVSAIEISLTRTDVVQSTDVRNATAIDCDSGDMFSALPTVGSQAIFTCPRGCRAEAGAQIWGSKSNGYYTMDSSICRAAIHQGVLTDGGGVVLVTRIADKSVFDGALLNGVQTEEWDVSHEAMTIQAGSCLVSKGICGNAPLVLENNLTVSEWGTFVYSWSVPAVLPGVYQLSVADLGSNLQLTSSSFDILAPPSSSRPLDHGAVAGIVIAVLAACALSAAVCVFICRRNRRPPGLLTGKSKGYNALSNEDAMAEVQLVTDGTRKDSDEIFVIEDGNAKGRKAHQEEEEEEEGDDEGDDGDDGEEEQEDFDDDDNDN